jgi:hypothetical protein
MIFGCSISPEYYIILIILTTLSLIAPVHILYYYIGRHFTKDETKRASFKINSILTATSISFFIFTSAYFIPGLLRMRSCGHYTFCLSNLKNIRDALETYKTDHHGNYPEKLSDLVPTHLSSIPHCPAAGKDSYSKTYQVFNDSENDIHNYTFYCDGRNHKTIISGNFPQYNSRSGLVIMK